MEGLDETSSGQTSRIKAKIGAGLGNLGAEAGKSGAEVENRGRSLKLGAAPTLCTCRLHSNPEQQKSDEENDDVEAGEKTTSKMTTKN